MVETKEFTWVIENFHMFSINFEIRDFLCLRSPLISVGNPCHSGCYLLLTKSPIRGFKCIIFKKNLTFYVKDSCAISVVCHEGKSHEDSLRENHFALEKCCLHLGTLTLQCRLSFNNVSLDDIASATELSKNISSLYESKILSDITLCTNDKEFFLHKFLLFKRAPKLFQELQLGEELRDCRVKVDISTPVLEFLVQYLYSGKLGTIPEEYLLEFYEMTEKYQLEKLRACNLSLDSFSSICTRINVEQRILNFDLGDKKERLEYVCFDCACFLVKTEPVMIMGTEIIGKDEDTLECVESGKLFYLIGTPNFQRINCTLNKLSWGKVCCARLTLEATTGAYSTYSVRSTPLISKVHPSICGIGILSFDIRDLYTNAQTNGNHDVTIFFGDESLGGNALNAHKPILAAMSPILASMFVQNKELSEVKISDISFGTGKRILYFMYSGEVTELSCATDIEMYIAANKYKISSLLKQCSAILSGHLSANTACDILVLADQHKDEILLSKVLRYIGSNRSVIMCSSKWIDLIAINPRLISQVLRHVSGALQKL